MTFRIAEKFKSVQGEGAFAGVPMAFIRFVGCSVGKKVCHHCDTDFDRTFEHLGGGEFEAVDLRSWIGDYNHVCFTGGEPLDQPELQELAATLSAWGARIHIETSGTVHQPWLDSYGLRPYVCVSPKPGYLPEMIARADELKIIVGGLGNGPGWPTIKEAVEWSHQGKIVYIQPRNDKFSVNPNTLPVAEQLVRENPSLRLSVQLHKLLRVR